MSDLTLAILMMLAVSTGFFQLGRHWGRSSSWGFRVFVQLSAVVGMFGYLAFLWNKPLLATLLPISSLIIVGNWLPCWAAFFVGVYMTSPGSSQIRKSVLGMLTLLLAVYSAVAPLTGQPPVCASTMSRRSLQYQTSPYTCSAACASSLLRIHDIAATENELAELCLTRRGTHWMGVYRGLKLKTKNSEWTVVVEPFSRETLQRNALAPCVLSLDVDVSGFSAEIDHGFQSHTGHSVVCLGQAGRGYVSVFDPSPDYGPECWDDSIFDCVRSGVILRLTPRDLNSAAALEVSRKLLAVKNARSIASM